MKQHLYGIQNATTGQTMIVTAENKRDAKSRFDEIIIKMYEENKEKEDVISYIKEMNIRPIGVFDTEKVKIDAPNDSNILRWGNDTIALNRPKESKREGAKDDKDE